MEQLGCHWMYCDEIWRLTFLFREPVEKVQVSLKYDKNNGYFTWRTGIHLWQYLAELLLKWEMFRKSCREYENTHLYPITFFPKIVRLWYNVKKYSSARGYKCQHNTAHPLCVLDNSSCRHAFKTCNTYCFSSTTVVTRTLHSVTSGPRVGLLLLLAIHDCSTLHASASHSRTDVLWGRKTGGYETSCAD